MTFIDEYLRYIILSAFNQIAYMNEFMHSNQLALTRALDHT